MKVEKITQAAIARRLGISQSAVSFVFNDHKASLLSEATRRKVLRTARQMGYRKRFYSLPEGLKTGNIAYVFAHSDERSYDAYYHRFLTGARTEAREQQCDIILYTQQDSNRVDFPVKNDGIIIAGSPCREKFNEILGLAQRIGRELPVVLLNWKVSGINSVMPGNAAGLQKAVDHLFSLGHRRIAFFGISPLDAHSEERLQGYRERLRERDLPEIPEFVQLPVAQTCDVAETDLLAENALRFWMSLSSKPSAIATVGDYVALALLRAALKLKIAVPGDISVVGFSNYTSCLGSTPSLTSVDQLMEKMGAKAVRLLIDRIRDPALSVEQVALDAELVVRKSTGEHHD